MSIVISSGNDLAFRESSSCQFEVINHGHAKKFWLVACCQNVWGRILGLGSYLQITSRVPTLWALWSFESFINTWHISSQWWSSVLAYLAFSPSINWSFIHIIEVRDMNVNVGPNALSSLKSERLITLSWLPY